jgi:hypothetical protein
MSGDGPRYHFPAVDGVETVRPIVIVARQPATA